MNQGQRDEGCCRSVASGQLEGCIDSLYEVTSEGLKVVVVLSDHGLTGVRVQEVALSEVASCGDASGKQQHQRPGYAGRTNKVQRIQAYAFWRVPRPSSFSRFPILLWL